MVDFFFFNIESFEKQEIFVSNDPMKQTKNYILYALCSHIFNKHLCILSKFSHTKTSNQLKRKSPNKKVCFHILVSGMFSDSIAIFLFPHLS